MLERLGSYLSKRTDGLGGYKGKIRTVACESPLADYAPSKHKSWHISFSKLYDLVREARNDALHQGAFARHLTDNAIQMAIVLEDALMIEHNRVSDYMIRDPVCASVWQPLSFIRQMMLANSFSYLPVWPAAEDTPHWGLVSDFQVAWYVRGCNRKDRLAGTLEDAIKCGLSLERAITCSADTPVTEVLDMSAGKLVLVVEGDQPERLLGIVTPFDLL